jgi:DnaJ-class molecular chaperone
MFIDDLNLLNLQPNATFIEVQRQYRVHAKRYHPDRPNGDEERFKEINNAFERLQKHFNRPQGDPFEFVFDKFAESIHRRRRCVDIQLTLEELFTGKTVYVQNTKISLPAGMIPDTVVHLPELSVDCFIRLARHTYFSVAPRSMNIVFQTNISLYEALTGYVGKIKHPNGKMLYISTPKNRVIHDNEQMTCKGLGINLGSGAVSDFVVRFNVLMPKFIDADVHRDALRNVFECNVPNIIKNDTDVTVNLT